MNDRFRGVTSNLILIDAQREKKAVLSFAKGDGPRLRICEVLSVPSMFVDIFWIFN